MTSPFIDFLLLLLLVLVTVYIDIIRHIRSILLIVLLCDDNIAYCWCADEAYNIVNTDCKLSLLCILHAINCRSLQNWHNCVIIDMYCSHLMWSTKPWPKMKQLLSVMNVPFQATGTSCRAEFPNGFLHIQQRLHSGKICTDKIPS